MVYFGENFFKRIFPVSIGQGQGKENDQLLNTSFSRYQHKMQPYLSLSDNRAWKISLKIMTSKYAFQFETQGQDNDRINFNHNYNLQYWPTFQYSFVKEKETYLQVQVRSH